MSVKDNAKQAALNLYPEEWETVSKEGLQVDQNANVRAVAEEVFEHVFKVMQSEDVAEGVAKAFLRRVKMYGNDRRFNTANMATALFYASCKIVGDSE